MIENKPLIFYVDPKWRRRRVHTPILNPWWGNPYEEFSLFSKEMFDAYSFDTSCYGITSNIEEADFVLAPYNHNNLLRHEKELFAECLAFSKKHKTPLLIDGSGDIEYRIEDKDVYILRYGGYRFINESNRIEIPLTVDDLLERCRKGDLQVRKKTKNKPVVGFTGWADVFLKQYFKTFIKELPVRIYSIFDSRYKVCRKGVLLRKKVIGILQKSPKLELKIHKRKSFSANIHTAEGDMKKLREEMVETILESDYALDVRGDSNNSARLFEILSLGRIPVIIDTERNFPFSSKVDYKSFALIVNFNDIYKLPQIIADFHNNLSPERFEEMQRNAREVYIKYFRIDAMMRHIVEELRGKVN